jgi:hypothetical protein
MLRLEMRGSPSRVASVVSPMLALVFTVLGCAALFILLMSSCRRSISM